MKQFIKSLLREGLTEAKIKKGSPEELLELLKLLPVSETAKYLAEEIVSDLNKFYREDINVDDKTYTYHPKDKCLKPYELNISFNQSNSSTSIGYASQHNIQIKYLNKDSREFSYTRGTGNVFRLAKPLYNIIKHECSHFYLEQKDVEECLYNTHPDGMKKYYHDRQEMVLHTREIWDDFLEDYPKWQSSSMETNLERIGYRVKNLRQHTNIGAPFAGGLQKKYTAFIMNNYVKPNYTNPEYAYTPPERPERPKVVDITKTEPKPRVDKKSQPILDKLQIKSLFNALHSIATGRNDYSKWKESWMKPFAVNSETKEGVMDFNINSETDGEFKLRIKKRDFETPYLTMVSKDGRAEQNSFKTFEGMIKYITNLKVSDYVKGLK